MPIPRRIRGEPVAPDPYDRIESATYAVERKPDTAGCQCLAGLCVEGLALPRIGQRYVHHDGREGTFVRRTKKLDPTTGAIVQTAVKFKHVSMDGRVTFWALKCAESPRMHSQFEVARTGRTDRSETYR